MKLHIKASKYLKGTVAVALMWGVALIASGYLVEGYVQTSVARLKLQASQARWKQGDCIQSQDFEEFETPLPIFKIIKVGKKKYLVHKAVQFKPKEVYKNVVYPFSLLHGSDFRKVPCPQNLK